MPQHHPLPPHRPSAGRAASSAAALMAVFAIAAGAGTAGAQDRPAAPGAGAVRTPDVGVDFGGTRGPLGAITDVAGVTVGQVTLISGDGKLVVGEGPVRTGVTAVLPRGRSAEPVFAATHALNGNGEMTGTIWVRESGLLSGPVMITNTHSVGAVHEGVIAWGNAAGRTGGLEFSLPVVAETYDGLLNDINGFHVRPEHARAALDSARSGPVAEGNVGGGTGMICHGFKGGIGTSSRVLPAEQGGYTVGVLVQCNYGSRRLFTVDGVPVGREIADLRPCRVGDFEPTNPWFREVKCPSERSSLDPADQATEGAGSIIVIVATDAPLLPHQLERVARRVPLAIGKMGGLGEDSSGDIFIAFSTQPLTDTTVHPVQMYDNARLNPLFEATVRATQEAILNSMLAAKTMTGADGVRVHALPHDRLRAAMRKYGR